MIFDRLDLIRLKSMKIYILNNLRFFVIFDLLKNWMLDLSYFLPSLYLGIVQIKYQISFVPSYTSKWVLFYSFD